MKAYDSALALPLSKKSKSSKGSILITKSESRKVQALLANNSVIKNYNSHLEELRKEQPKLFTKMTKAEFLTRVSPAIKLVRQRVKSKGASRISSIAQQDSCLNECNLTYQPEYDYLEFMYNQERSQCYPNDCGDALTNPNYNECSDQQTACADAAWRYWMWDCWIEVDRQLAECRSYCGDTYGYPEVTVNNGRLEFATMTEYEAVIDRLEDEYEAHSAAFYDQYDILTDDEVYELEIAQGFDDLKPYKDFESFFGFSSLRASTTNEIEPVASLSVVDESEQTLLDVYGNVKIGGTIINMATVIDEGEPEPEICYSSYKKDAEVVLGSNKIYEKIWGRKNDTRFPARDRAMLKVLKYNNKRKATKMNVRGFGNAYNEFCFGATPFDTDWKKNSDKRRKRMCIRFWPVTPQTNLNGIFYYKSGNITGQFRANGNEFTLVW